MISAAEVNQALKDRYLVLELLGTGTVSTVFLADDVTLNRRMVLKVFDEDIATNPAFAEHFETTVATAAKLSHPHLVNTRDWGCEPLYYLATEYFKGGSLRSMLEAGHLLSRSQALVVALETARVLEYIHSKGFVHFGVKPSNLLFDSKGRVYLSDFGVGFLLAEAGLVNAYGYSVPEMTHSQDSQASSISSAFDVYCLAQVIVEAITGASQLPAETESGSGSVDFSTESGSGSVDFSDDSDDADLLISHAGIPTVFRPALGPLWYALEQTTDPVPAGRPEVAEVARKLLSAAELLPRPELLSLVSTAQGSRDVFSRATPPTQGSDAKVSEKTAGSASDTAQKVLSTPERKLLTDDATDLKSYTTDPTDQPDVSSERTASFTKRLLLKLKHSIGVSDDSPHNFRGVFSVAAVVLVALTVGGIWVWFNVWGRYQRVPELVGMTSTEAMMSLKKFDWDISQITVRSSGSVSGEVVDVEPSVGTRLNRDETLKVFVSLGEPLVPVPDLHALSIGDAKEKLEDLGLVLTDPENATQVHDNLVPVGFVVGIDLSAKLENTYELEAGTEVELLISAGPVEEIVPSVPPGGSLTVARQLLLDASFAPVLIDRFSTDVPIGKVIGFDPPSGTPAQPGTLVEVLVSSGGARIELPPEVIDLEISILVSQLELLGFEVEVVGSGETVVSIIPNVGHTYPYGTRVVIFTSSTISENQICEGTFCPTR